MNFCKIFNRNTLGFSFRKRDLQKKNDNVTKQPYTNNPLIYMFQSSELWRGWLLRKLHKNLKIT